MALQSKPVSSVAFLSLPVAYKSRISLARKRPRVSIEAENQPLSFKATVFCVDTAKFEGGTGPVGSFHLNWGANRA